MSLREFASFGDVNMRGSRNDFFLPPCLNRYVVPSKPKHGQKGTIDFVVAQNVRWGFRVILHYFKCTYEEGCKPILRVVGQITVLSNYANECTGVVPYFKHKRIAGVIAQIGGYNLKVRNPKFNDFIINGR